MGRAVSSLMSFTTTDNTTMLPHCVWAQCSAIVRNQIISVDLGSLTQAWKESRGQAGYQLGHLGSWRDGEICPVCVELLHSCKVEVKRWRFGWNKNIGWKANFLQLAFFSKAMVGNKLLHVFTLSDSILDTRKKEQKVFTVIWLCNSLGKKKKIHNAADESVGECKLGCVSLTFSYVLRTCSSFIKRPVATSSLLGKQWKKVVSQIVTTFNDSNLNI